ncbi:hypothetical protein EQ875_01540 [Photobacterium damselae subsp. damselae]|uniref:hypothetical protein n=1 Tax=Photobacterium damselae TaxID=38293 RepID=UPI00109B935A|nr:hypothetical protein [Photobacterium damselae]TGZ35261.1 hypothetical protein EQ875_01540 [Photobacterium damselae subsp. damselae]
MSFSLYLKNKISKNQITRNNLIAQLNLYCNEFEYLDAITFSRWITNKTTPSPYKQILIAYFFKENIIDFIRFHLSIKKEPKLTFQAYEKAINFIANSYTNVSYLYNDNSSDYSYELMTMSGDNHDDILGNFYKNFKIYDSIYPIIKGETHYCILHKKDNYLISHISFFKSNKKIINQLSKSLNVDISGDYVVNLSHITDSRSFYIMHTTLLCLLYKYNARNYIYILREEFLDLFSTLPYEEIIYGNKGHNNKNVYILRINLLSILSHPFMALLLKNTLRTEKNIFSNIEQLSHQPSEG